MAFIKCHAFVKYYAFIKCDKEGESRTAFALLAVPAGGLKKFLDAGKLRAVKGGTTAAKEKVFVTAQNRSECIAKTDTHKIKRSIRTGRTGMKGYIDLHCDTLEQALKRKRDTAKELNGTMVDVKRLKTVNAKAQFFAMFLPQRENPEWFGLKTMPPLWELMEMMYRIYRNTLQECSDFLAPAGCIEELRKNQAEGKISAFLTVENGSVLNGDIANLERLYGMGVRLVTLTWNDANCIGYPHSTVRNEMERGLTDFGKEAVLEMNRMGIVVDVSHLSDGGFWDVVEISRKPFAASHSNCRALSPATRNLTDDMIRALAKKGGIAGVNFAPAFLNGDEADCISRVERICDHICHLTDKGGVECAGIGTDFDGIEGTFEIADCTQMELLFDALHRRGFSDDTIDKIAYQNAERVIRESMG